MTKLTQRTFTSGELDPALHQRADLARYASGLSVCRNFIIKPQGGVYNRPGLRFIGEVKDSTRKVRLIPFQFNTLQAYALEFGHLTMRVIKDGGYVLNGAGPAIYEIVTPYTEDELFDLVFSQTADVMTIVHRNHEARDLSRVDHDNWSLDIITFASTVVAPGAPSLASVGGGHGSTSKTYKYVVTATSVEGVESLASPVSSISIGSLTSTAGVKLTWTAVAGAEFYTVYKDSSNGTGVYGFIGDSNTLTYSDFNLGEDTSRTPPKENTPISVVDEYPGSVGYYQQRRLFANSTNSPQTMWATQTGIYDSLRSSTPTRDSDAITFTLSTREVNEIRHIVALEDLILLTSGSENRVTEGQDFVLTPSTIGAKPQSYNGASKVRPATIDDSVIYVHEKGTRVRDLNYSVTEAKSVGSDLSILSAHLFEGKTIVEMAFASEPYNILWCVLSDGTVVAMTYHREQQVWGWHRHDTDGTVESVCVISEDGRDAPYFVVNRNINGVDVRYVERMEPRFDADAVDSFFVDSGLSYDGVPVTVMSGLDHLEGKNVSVIADGNVVKNLTVASGSITLPRESSKVHVGLGYVSDIETLGIDDSQQTTQGRKKSINEVAIRFLKTRGGWVGPDFDNLTEIKPRFDSDGYDTVALKTMEERITIRPDWNDNGKVTVRQLDPLPMSILAITPEFDIGG